MNTHAHPTLPSAAASSHASATPALELREARLARDGLATLLRAERAAAADFLLALADFDQRRGWEALGYASLFAFLNVEMRLSKGGAFFRQTAARLLQRFPDLAEPLRDGRLCITTVVELSKVLTATNGAEVVPRFYGCSSQEAKEVVASLVPVASPPVRPVVTVLPPQRSKVSATAKGVTPPRSTSVALPPDAPVEQVQSTELSLTHPARGLPSRDDVEPLSADLRRQHVTVSRRFLDKVACARDGLSHAMPSASTEQVLEAALDLLIEKQARARGKVKMPRVAVAPAPPRTDRSTEPFHRRAEPRKTIPAAVRRAVWDRDQGRCAWPIDGGGCCGSTHRLQLDHIVPWARGGESNLANLRLACAAHNRLAARQAFGARCVERYAG